MSRILTTSQKITLKTFIEANATWMSLPNDLIGATQIALELQNDASPNYIVWRNELEEHEVINKTSELGTNWNWKAFMEFTTGEQFAWWRMFEQGFVVPSNINIRQGFADIIGTANADRLALRDHMVAAAKRKANIFEKVFVDSSGTGTVADPDTMIVDGFVNGEAVIDVMGW